MDYKTSCVGNPSSEKKEFLPLQSEQMIFDDSIFWDPLLDIEEKIEFFIISKKSSEQIGAYYTVLPMMWDYIDVFFDATAGFLECMQNVPIPIFDSMFGFSNIIKRIKPIPNKITAQIRIFLYPYFSKPAFDIKTIVELARNDCDPIFLNLLNIEIDEYKTAIRTDILQYLFDTEEKTLNFVEALIELVTTYCLLDDSAFDILYKIIEYKETQFA